MTLTDSPRIGLKDAFAEKEAIIARQAEKLKRLHLLLDEVIQILEEESKILKQLIHEPSST